VVPLAAVFFVVAAAVAAFGLSLAAFFGLLEVVVSVGSSNEQIRRDDLRDTLTEVLGCDSGGVLCADHDFDLVYVSTL